MIEKNTKDIRQRLVCSTDGHKWRKTFGGRSIRGSAVVKSKMEHFDMSMYCCYMDCPFDRSGSLVFQAEKIPSIIKAVTPCCCAQSFPICVLQTEIGQVSEGADTIHTMCSTLERVVKANPSIK